MPPASPARNPPQPTPHSVPYASPLAARRQVVITAHPVQITDIVCDMLAKKTDEKTEEKTADNSSVTTTTILAGTPAAAGPTAELEGAAVTKSSATVSTAAAVLVRQHGR